MRLDADLLRVNGKGAKDREVLVIPRLRRLLDAYLAEVRPRRLDPFASRLRAAGADLQLIQEALGHVDIRTTTIHAHLATPARLAEVARLLGDEMPAGATR